MKIGTRRYGVAQALVVTAAAMAGLPTAGAANYTITVDMATRTVNPENPTVNLEAIDTSYVRISSATDPRVTIGIMAFQQMTAGGGRVEPQDAYWLTRDQFQLTFRPCDSGLEKTWKTGDADKALRRYTTFAKSENDAKKPLDAGAMVYALPCPSAVRLYGGMGWDAYAKNGTSVPLTVESAVDGDTSSHLFAVHVQKRSFALSWSTGLAFLGTRDTRLRLEPGTDDAQNVAVLDEGAFPYRVAAFAHYTPIKWDRAGLCFGVATDVPVSGLTAMLGVSFNAWTLPVADSGHLSLGIMYGPRKQLRAEYEDRTTVGGDVTADAMLEDRYAASAFLAVTFSFFGGEVKFKGVFAGKDEGNWGS